MRIKTVFIFCFIWLLCACSNTDNDTSLVFLNGDGKKLSDFEGQWLLINYWAAWCKPCLNEIPELNVINARSDVEVLAFNYDDLDETLLRKQLDKFDIQYRSIVIDPALLFKQAKPRGLPATIVVNQRGEFVKWLYGAQSRQSLLEVIVQP